MISKTLLGKIVTISGPLVVGQDIPKVSLYDVVKVGNEQLMGEVIELRKNKAWIQVYEDTGGLQVSEPIESTGKPLSVTLAPGIASRFYDGIQRPLELIAKETGSFIKRGVNVPVVDEKRIWQFRALRKEGEIVEAGDVIGMVKETDLIDHKIMVPYGTRGRLVKIKSRSATVNDVIAIIEVNGVKKELTMVQHWPIRIPRPTGRKLLSTSPLYTGQRIVDVFFPIVKGGTAATPGPFGSGKTVIQQQLAKWSDAQVIVYVGCGERGNEMTDVLKEFPELKDPLSGKPLMDRTVLIANTSNMPIAAREASIYTGITIAEYYRDMGYDVALMADSTSRWAEALREMSGRLEEMPGEEGYPAYLSSRIAAFYERAGVVEAMGQESRRGSVTIVGAVSPPGGDMSEPVSQSSLRVVKVFWALDGSLAYARHYPAIHWLNSYSLYADVVSRANHRFAADFGQMRQESLDILREENRLQEIIRIVGMDGLSREERVLLETAKSLREDFLQQNAFDEVDTYTSMDKQIIMMRAILTLYHEVLEVVKSNPEIEIEKLFDANIKNEIAGFKYIPEKNIESIRDFVKSLPKRIRMVVKNDEDESLVKPNIHTSVSHAEM